MPTPYLSSVDEKSVPFFMKKLSSNKPLPADLNVREFPIPDTEGFRKERAR